MALINGRNSLDILKEMAQDLGGDVFAVKAEGFLKRAYKMGKEVYKIDVERTFKNLAKKQCTKCIYKKEIEELTGL